MKMNTQLFAACLAVLLAVGLFFRTQAQHSRFEKSVHAALKTSEGYDERFIEKVNKLEAILAERAQFAYRGGKDPMTGRVRQVVKPVQTKKKAKRPKRIKAKPIEKDPVKLTAIIADEKGQFTAIVMDGDRSIAVEEGDWIRKRKVYKITSQAVLMKDSHHAYKYDISGKRVKRKLAGPE